MLSSSSHESFAPSTFTLHQQVCTESAYALSESDNLSDYLRSPSSFCNSDWGADSDENDSLGTGFMHFTKPPVFLTESFQAVCASQDSPFLVGGALRCFLEPQSGNHAIVTPVGRNCESTYSMEKLDSPEIKNGVIKEKSYTKLINYY
eukprot:GHVR01103500.1.p1 GENE.GHVR01103500.1~~GHVR01103500.1.p1  ORF type:complete len:148 (+),score=7.22 GHVR01103500.1:983-1426(+)